MERSFADRIPVVTPASADATNLESEPFPTRRPWPKWLLVLGFWTVIVLVYSTRQEMRVGTFEWVPISWYQALKASVVQWYAWGVLSFVIYRVNRALPFPPNALVRRLLVHIPLSLLFTTLYAYMDFGATQLLDAPSDRASWVGPTVTDTMLRVVYRFGTFVYWAIAMGCVALDYQAHVNDGEVRRAKLERLLSDARLATLRTQLDPHFLFNTLNSISAYVESAPRKARLMIEQLGDMLRLSLEQLGDMLRLSLEHASEQEIPLDRELTFVDRYIQLQLVRFDERLDVQVDVDPEVTQAAVPTFLLQPLIENAIRHGLSKLTTPGYIEVAAWRAGDRLHLRVRDNGAGLPTGWTLGEHAGIGLKNTRARLEHLYGPDEYALVVSNNAEGAGACVDVTLPFRNL